MRPRRGQTHLLREREGSLNKSSIYIDTQRGKVQIHEKLITSNFAIRGMEELTTAVVKNNEPKSVLILDHYRERCGIFI